MTAGRTVKCTPFSLFYFKIQHPPISRLSKGEPEYENYYYYSVWDEMENFNSFPPSPPFVVIKM